MGQPWRLIFRSESDLVDLLALPAALVEGRVAGRYLLSGKESPETIIIQRVRQKGVVVGAEVSVDRQEAERAGFGVVVQSRAGRGSPRAAGSVSLAELMLRSKSACPTRPAEDRDVACLVYTSGTTGNPKGVMITHGNLLAECAATDDVIVTDTSDRFATLVPFFHIYGLAVGLVIAFKRGCASVLIPQYAPRFFLTQLTELQISVMLAIPTQYFHLLMRARRTPVGKHRLKYCISGAAALPVPVLDAFQATFGLTITEGYGMTESTAAVTVNPPDRARTGSIGVPAAGVELKVVDDRGVELPPGKAGEILIRGPVVSPGYYNLPAETAQAIRDGWLHSGDIGYRDADGYFFITDRKKDIIIKGGFNISPREIEDLLTAHPKIREAAVIGSKVKEGREEAIKAFVVLEEGASMTPEEILAYCRQALAAYKAPDAVEIRDYLPKGPSGKVLRRELQPDFKDARLIDKDES